MTKVKTHPMIKDIKFTGGKTTVISGVKTEAKKAKARANAKGPKQGSAQSNQTAKLSAEALDKISSSKADSSGDHHVVTSVGGKTVTFPSTRWAGAVRKASGIGQSLAALELELAKEPPQPKLARGVTGRDAPHASKAVADNNAAARKAKAPVKAAKPAKAPKAAKADTSANRKYTVATTMDKVGAREGTKRHDILTCIFGCKDTDSAKACIGKKGYASEASAFINWAAKQTYIRFA